MSAESVKKETLEHYDRMIKWAEAQESLSRVNKDLMYKSLGENWYSDSCPYCIAVNNRCRLCKLTGANETSTECCNGLWKKMVIPRTWGEWIENAKRVKKYIEENG